MPLMVPDCLPHQVIATFRTVQLEKERDTTKQAKSLKSRDGRLQTFNKSLKSLYDSQWQHVSSSLEILDSDSKLTSDLASLLKAYFEPLFDTYLHYAKIEDDEQASELYRMTEGTWKQLLKDAQVIGAEQSHATCLTSLKASQIFKQVNQRRDNLDRALGGGRGAPDGERAAITQAVMSTLAPRQSPRVAQSPSNRGPPGTPGTTPGTLSVTQWPPATPGSGASSSGFASAVVRGHEAGSLYSFTFSEFLEGLVVVALELYPPPPPQPLSSAHVLEAVQSLLKQRLAHARGCGVLQFRRMVLNSVVLEDAVEALSKRLDALYNKYSKEAKVMRGAAGGAARLDTGGASMMTIKRFLEMCEEAELIGPSLSRHQAKLVFVHSLEIAPDGGALRKPLLARGPEFHEAILRLTHKYQLTKEDAQLGADGRTSLRKSCKLQTSADKFSNAGMAARAQADVHAAVAGNVVTNDASEEEAAILEKLPLVCGKLLALTAWNMSESPRVAPTPSSRGVPPTPSSRAAVTPAVPFGPLG